MSADPSRRRRHGPSLDASTATERRHELLALLLVLLLHIEGGFLRVSVVGPVITDIPSDATFAVGEELDGDVDGKHGNIKLKHRVEIAVGAEEVGVVGVNAQETLVRGVKIE